MDFDLSESHQLLQRTIREFAASEIAPGATARDLAGQFPHELVTKLAGLGLLGVKIPEAYGGAALDALSFAIVIEEIAYADAAVALLVASHNSLCAGHILAFGNQAQKQRYLPPLARGEVL